MIRVVLDANVFVSALLSKNGPPGRILDAWLERQFDLFISPQIHGELTRVLNYPKIRDRLELAQIMNLLIRLSEFSQKTKGKLEVNDLTVDPFDNIYLACAIEGNCDYLVTGNTKHFIEALTKYPKLRILNPDKFLDILHSL